MKKDYCDWLKEDPSRVKQIEIDWAAHPEGHDTHAAIVRDALSQTPVRSIVEIGCGTGLLAQRFGVDEYRWVGFDKSELMLEWARKRNPTREFHVGDIRGIDQDKMRQDAVVCMGTMKHFDKAEWLTIFSRVIGCGSQYAVIEVPDPSQHPDLAKRSKPFIEDEGDFTHVWVSPSFFKPTATRLGFELVKVDSRAPIEPTYVFKRAS